MQNMTLNSILYIFLDTFGIVKGFFIMGNFCIGKCVATLGCGGDDALQDFQPEIQNNNVDTRVLNIVESSLFYEKTRTCFSVSTSTLYDKGTTKILCCVGGNIEKLTTDFAVVELHNCKVNVIRFRNKNGEEFKGEINIHKGAEISNMNVTEQNTKEIFYFEDTCD